LPSFIGDGNTSDHTSSNKVYNQHIDTPFQQS
jgi:hypothetical protein